MADSIKSNGIYLVAEQGCLNKESGAYHHINTGLANLNKDFKMVFFLKAKKIQLAHVGYRESLEKSSFERNHHKGSYIKGSLKDLSILLKNLADIPGLVKAFKKENPAFIYERTSYLNPAALIASRILGIPHFYEANGLQFERMDKYFKSLLKPLNQRIEKWTYRKSSHVFFVGSYGNYWRLKSRNWTNVENGIEKEFVRAEFLPKISDGKIHLVFVGSLMQHHRPDILREALQLLNSEYFHIHLVGSKLDDLYSDLLNNSILVTHHGFIIRQQLNSLISKYHIGIIAGSPEFNSNMKLFDYALAKCAVVAPNVDVLKVNFMKELLFFDGTSVDLASKLNSLITDNNLREDLGLRLYEKIKFQFTWDIIFKNKIEIIKNKITE